MRIVTEEELRAVVDEEVALRAVERAFTALAEGRVVQPAPMAFDFPSTHGEVHVKGAYLEGAPIFAIKLASGFYDNPDKGLPTSSGLVLVLDAGTGLPLALFHDNAFLTELRTAAAGALAARLLSAPRISKLGVLGTGAQARYQLRAITRVVDVASVAAWSPSAERRQRYAEEMEKALGLRFTPCETASEAVQDATLVLTVTPARSPLAPAEAFRDDATVIAVGSDGPDKQELDPSLLGRADKVIADRLSQCIRLGEIHHAVRAGALREDDVYGELSDVVAGRKPGREGDELIVCDLTGVGAQDAAIAQTAWEAVTE